MVIELDSDEEIRKMELLGRSDTYLELLDELKHSFVRAGDMVIKLYEQGKRDGLTNDIIRNDIVEALDGIVKERRLRDLLPLELKRGYHKKVKDNSAIIAELAKPKEAKPSEIDKMSISEEGTIVSAANLPQNLSQEQPLLEEEELEEDQQLEQDMDQYDEATLRNVIIPQLQSRIRELERRPMGHDALYNRIHELKKELAAKDREIEELKQKQLAKPTL